MINNTCKLRYMFVFSAVLLNSLVSIAEVLKYSESSSLNYFPPEGYTRRQPIIIESDFISGTSNLIDFPFLVTLDHLNPEIVDGGTYSAQNGGGDLLFTSDEEGNNRLPIEVVEFVTDSNQANRRCQVWVKIPSISTDTDTTIYVWYHNPGQSQPSASSTYGSQSVWSDYEAVWHMETDPGGTAPQIMDATGNGHDLSSSGNMDSGDLITGVIGNGISFDGANDQLQLATNLLHNNTFTFSGWINWTGAGIYNGVLARKGPYNGFWVNSGTGGRMVFYDNQAQEFTNNNTVPPNTSVRYDFVSNSGDYQHYINAVADIAEAQQVTSGSFSHIGSEGGSAWFSGWLDEIRVSSLARSASWIETEHNNQLNPSTIANAGLPEDVSSSCDPVANPWSSTDVGAVAATGSACTDGTSFEVSGSGADIWGGADEFQFVHQQMSGDMEIVARVVSMENTDPWAKAGIMIRNGLSANAATALLSVSPDPQLTGPGYTLQSRLADGTSMNSSIGPQLTTFPIYLRLVREGDTFTAYGSPTNGNWQLLGSQSITMGQTINVGLVVTSHDDGTLNNAVFDNVSLQNIQSCDPVALPWSSTDVGAVAATGSACTDGTSFEVSGSGADIWGGADEFQFVHQQVSGDIEVIARVVSMENTDPWAKAGIMIRNGLSANAATTLLSVSPNPQLTGPGYTLQSRLSDGTSMNSSIGPELTTLPIYLRLVREGDTFTAYGSPTNGNWQLLGSQTINMAESVQVGLAVTSHDDGTLNNVVFDNVSVQIIQSCDPVASPWSSTDVGAVAAAGSACYDGSQFEIAGSGADIWGGADEFQFVHQQVSGDVEVIARVVSMENTDPWAKVGVMIRESIAANSKYAFMLFASNPMGNGIEGYFQSRSETGIPPSSIDNEHGPLNVGSTPYYVRLVRTGNTFSGYISATNGNWQLLGSFEMDMAESVQIGLAVTSHDDGVLNNVVFDEVSVIILDDCAVYQPLGNSGSNSTGNFSDVLAFVEWGNDFSDGIQVGDSTTQTLSDGSVATITVAAADSGAASYQPSGFDTYIESIFQTVYDDDQKDYSLYGTVRDALLDVTFNVSVVNSSGVSLIPNLVLIDTESTGTDETLEGHTNGGIWKSIEPIAYINQGPSISGLGTNHVVLSATTNGVPLLVSESATVLRIVSTNQGNNGLQGFALGLLLSCESSVLGTLVNTEGMPYSPFEIVSGTNTISNLFSGTPDSEILVETTPDANGTEEFSINVEESENNAALNLRITKTESQYVIEVYENGNWRLFSSEFYDVNNNKILFYNKAIINNVPFSLNLIDGIIYNQSGLLTISVDDSIPLDADTWEINGPNNYSETISPNSGSNDFNWDGTQAESGLYQFTLEINGKKFNGQFLIL